LSERKRERKREEKREEKREREKETKREAPEREREWQQYVCMCVFMCICVYMCVCDSNKNQRLSWAVGAFASQDKYLRRALCSLKRDFHLSKETSISQKSPTLSQKSPTFSQKSPTFSPKNITFSVSPDKYLKRNPDKYLKRYPISEEKPCTLTHNIHICVCVCVCVPDKYSRKVCVRVPDKYLRIARQTSQEKPHTKLYTQPLNPNP